MPVERDDRQVAGDRSPSAGSGATLDVELLRFSSPGQAVIFQQQTDIPDESAKHSPFAAIPGAIALDGTKPSDGYYDHMVVATKGKMLMLLDYTAPAAGPAPADLAGWAEQQYENL